MVKRGLHVTQLIQVCADVDDPRTRQREVRALLKASQELGCEDLLVVTDHTELEEHASWYGTERTVRLVPLWKWLTRSAPTTAGSPANGG